MAHEIHFDDDKKVIRCRHYGQGDVSDWEVARDRVVEVQQESGVSEVLVDLRELVNAPPTIEIYQFASELPTSLQIGILFPDALAEDMKFLETVAFNRGRNIQMFDTEAAALEWLGAAG